MMNKEIKKLVAKTEDLEQQIETIVNETKNSNSASVFQKNFLNYSILEEKTFVLSSIYATYSANILLSLKLNLFLPYAQSVETALLINNSVIKKEKFNCKIGDNVLDIIQSYYPQMDQNIEISIKVKPLESRQIILKNANLTIIGASQNEKNSEYKICERQNDYLISYIFDDKLFYTVAEKSNLSIDLSDFTFLSSSKSHCFVYDENSKKTYLFRVDNNYNLFYSELFNSEEIFIANNVKSVSAVYGNNRIFVAFIIENQCYYLEISNNLLSVKKSIDLIFGAKNCFVTYNQTNKKYYILITTITNENYLIESINEKHQNSENISFNCSFTLSETGENEWILFFITN